METYTGTSVIIIEDGMFRLRYFFFMVITIEVLVIFTSVLWHEDRGCNLYLNIDTLHWNPQDNYSLYSRHLDLDSVIPSGAVFPAKQIYLIIMFNILIIPLITNVTCPVSLSELYH